MANGFLELGDDGLANWAQNFHAQIVATPGGFGVTAEAAAALGAAVATFDGLVLECGSSRRTSVLTEAKRASRAALLAVVRPMVRAIAARPGLTDQDRAALCITVPRPPTRGNVPEESPTVWVDAVAGYTVHMRVGRPAGTGKPARANRRGR